MKKVIAFMLLISCTCAWADDWKLIANDTSKVFINQKSIKSVKIYGKTYSQAWIKTVLDTPRKFNKTYVSDINSLFIVSCEEETLAMKSSKLRLKEKIIESVSYQDFELKFEPIEPGTNAEFYSNAICNPEQ